MRLKLVVSDFHLGKGRILRDGTQNILEDFIYDREFAEFLSYYCTGPYADAEVELILNGDILNLLQIDSWGVFTHLVTERAMGRGIEKIVEGHPDFFAALRKFASTPHHSVAYVIGNHDVGMIFPLAQKLFSEAIGADVQFFEVAYEFEGVHVEHGQQYERFAATNLKHPFIQAGLPEPVLNLPWGSLFTAVVLPGIKQERPHVDKVRPIQTFVSWALIHDLFWGLKTVLKIARFVFQTLIFKTRYQIREGIVDTIGLLREVSVYPNYDRIAFRFLEKNPHIHTLIFGHTHILRYRQWRKGREYFNEGTWNEVTSLDLSEYGTRTRLTYAMIEFPEAMGDRPKTLLKEWKGLWHPVTDVLV